MRGFFVVAVRIQVRLRYIMKGGGDEKDLGSGGDPGQSLYR